VQYRYYAKGQKEHPGEVMEVSENTYQVLPANKLQFTGISNTTYFYDPSKILKVWQTLPYSTGKRRKAPLIRMTSSTRNSSMYTRNYEHQYDENDLIIYTKESGSNFVLETFFKNRLAK
jgi:hypothetical protein